MANTKGSKYTDKNGGAAAKSGGGLGRGTPHMSGTKHTNKGHPRPPHTDNGKNGTHRAQRT